MSNEKIIEILCSLLHDGGSKTEDLNNTSLKVGTSYLIRTVTMMYTGRMKAITDTDFVLEDAAWIADSGRYNAALKDGTLNEVEPYLGDVSVSRASYVDATEWTHALPRIVK